MTDSVSHKIFLITCTGFRLRQRHQTAVLHLNLWKLPHVRYSPAKHHVSEVHLIGYASYFNKKSNLSSKLISRSKKLTSEQASWIFLKNYLGILRPGSNCSQVWHQLEVLWQNHVRSITLKPFKISSWNYIQILTNIRWLAECKYHNSCIDTLWVTSLWTL